MRLADWEARLYAVLARAQARPFKLGTFDCVIFTGECIRACTGVDVFSPWVHLYRRHTPDKVTDAYGGLCQIITDQLGTDPVSASEVQRGDPVLLYLDGQKMLGVCDGHRALFVTEKGLRPIRMKACAQGWAT